MDVQKPFPTQTELMWPTIEAIRSLGGSATIQEITPFVVSFMSLSEEQQAEPHADGRRTKLEYRLAWARTNLKRIEAIENSDRGVWSITAYGENLREEEIRDLVRDFKKADRGGSTETVVNASENGESDENLEDSWKSELIDAILDMTPGDFEKLAQRLLRESGFKTVRVSGKPGDGGIDGTGILQLNLVSIPVAFQCKRYKGSVGSDTVRDFRGAVMGRCEKGLIITTGNFTTPAQEEATRDGALAIDLVDGNRLCDLLKDLRLGVRVKTIEQVEIDSSWFKSI